MRKYLVISITRITFAYQIKRTMTNEIKVGDFIKGSYKFGCIAGIVVKLKKSTVVIKKCNQYYNEYTTIESLANVTRSRITQIGLKENETIK